MTTLRNRMLSRRSLLCHGLVVCALLVGLRTAAASTPQFTPEEQAWIRAHPVVHYAGAPHISPLEDIVEGEYRGLIAAYLETVSARTGITFKLVPTSSWEASQDLFQSGKVDLFPNAHPSVLRADVNAAIRYTDAYFASPFLFVTRGEADSTFAKDSLNGQRVAIRGDVDVQRILTTLRPGVIPVQVNSPEESLQSVLEGRAHASIGTEATLQPLLRRKYGQRLGVASMVDLPPYRAQMGVRASEPVLYAILQKSLASISAHESDEIYETYLTQADYGSPTLWSIMHYRALELFLATLGMVLLSFFAWRTWAERRRAIRSERAKTRFLATMSHEIRTPINAMLGSIEMLSRTPLDERQKRFTEGATVAAEALIDLLDNVLDLSKLDAGKLTLEKLPTDLDQLIGSVVALARPGAEEKGLAIDLEIDHPHDLLVVLDPTRVRQVLNNLLGNAVKFTRHGSINVDVKVVPTNEQGAATLHLRVIDTGVGIALEQQARLFKAYSQADDSTTREFGGTGLGLTICRELVEMMGGSIRLDSVPGTGTMVALTLPVTLVAPSQHSIASASRARARADEGPGADNDAPHVGGSVLVVEDHPGNQALIREQLLELGVRPTLVDSGAAALQALEDGSFDLVLMDCHMPGMDGYETTRRIRARPRQGPHLPIVAISASTGAEHLAECLECGMDGVLRKPLRLEELRSTLALWPVQFARSASQPAVAATAPPTIDHLALLREDLAGMQQAVAARDRALAGHHAHRLAGAAFMRSHEALGELALELEMALAEGGLPTEFDMSELASAVEALSSADGPPDA
ncbi:ATP-binding protein [Xanthomonas sp. 60]